MPELVIPGITDPSTLACLARARKLKQYIKAVENALNGVCPFCDIDRNYNQIVAENEFWYAWPCNPPEDNTKLHFLFVPKRHIKSSEELRTTEIILLWGRTDGIRQMVHKMFSYESCGTLMRDGDATLSAGTIQHLHVHDMVPNGTGRVESPFYKGDLSEAEGVRRAIVFEKLRSGKELIELSVEEFKLVEGKI